MGKILTVEDVISQVLVMALPSLRSTLVKRKVKTSMPTGVAPVLSGKLQSLCPLTFHIVVQVVWTRLAVIVMMSSHFL